MKKILSSVVAASIAISTCLAPASASEDFFGKEKNVSERGIDTIVSTSDRLFRDKDDKSNALTRKDSKEIREFFNSFSSDMGSSEETSETATAMMIVGLFAGFAAYRGLLFAHMPHS